MDNNQWTMNCVLAGAHLFKLLYQGRISKVDALAKIKELSSDLTAKDADYLLVGIQNLIY